MQLEAILPPMGHVTTSEDMFYCFNLGEPPADAAKHPTMHKASRPQQLSFPQCHSDTVGKP